MKSTLVTISKVVISFIASFFLYVASTLIIIHKSTVEGRADTAGWPFPPGLFLQNIIFWMVIAFFLLEVILWVGRKVSHPALAIVGKIILSIMVGLFLFAITVRLGMHPVSPPCSPGGPCSMMILGAPGGFPLSIWGGWSSNNFYSTTAIIIDIIFWIVLSFVGIELISRKMKKIK
jgi:hypothetical protein